MRNPNATVLTLVMMWDAACAMCSKVTLFDLCTRTTSDFKLFTVDMRTMSIGIFSAHYTHNFESSTTEESRGATWGESKIHPGYVSSPSLALPPVRSASSGLGSWRCDGPRLLIDGRVSILRLGSFQCIIWNVERTLDLEARITFLSPLSRLQAEDEWSCASGGSSGIQSIFVV
jgi:hypothetical protein